MLIPSPGIETGRSFFEKTRTFTASMDYDKMSKWTNHPTNFGVTIMLK